MLSVCINPHRAHKALFMKRPSVRSASSHAEPVTAATPAKSLADISKQYKGFLLDQFGVLHDGQKPYPGAIEAVQRLAEAGGRILILSNSSRRSSGTLGRLAKMGFEESWFIGAITSGEMTHRYLQARPTEWWQKLGSSCLHITWGSRGAVSIDDLNLKVVESPQDAMFILVHGTQAIGLPGGSIRPASLPEIKGLLQLCDSRPDPPPMIVANPDLVTVDGDSLAIMPGTLAKAYREMGGPVQLMGKPDPIIYQAAAELLQLPPSQLLAVGDSLEHDIAGACSAGVDSLFIAGGIHAAELGVSMEQRAPDSDALSGLYSRHAVEATYVLPYMNWEEL